MSKQLLVEYTTFEVTPQQINESLSENDGRLIVNGVLQRAESKNQNEADILAKSIEDEIISLSN